MAYRSATMATYLKRRGDRWFVQKKVPAHLQPVVGAKLVYRALGTSDRKVAESRRHAVLAQIEDDFLRASASLKDHPSSPSWVQRIAHELRSAVERGDMPSDAANEIMHDHIEQHLKAAGLTRDTVTDVHTAGLRASAGMVSNPDLMPLSAAIESYLGEKQGRVRESTLAAKRRDLETFSGWLQADLNVADISRLHTGRYVSRLMENGKAHKTNRDTVSALSAFFAWAIRRGIYPQANPWAGQAADLRGSKRGTSVGDRRRRAWRPDELQKMVAALPADDVRWQACVIAMYSGMRLDEIASMKSTDVNLEDGYMVVSEGKTDSSVRQVPIHPVIKPLITRLAKGSTDEFLLHGLKPGGEDDKRGHGLSKRIGRWLRVNLEITDPGVVFHSLRNTFIHACENAGIPQNTTELLVGHARQSMSYGTYSRGVDLPVLQRAIEKVSYGSVGKSVARCIR